VRVERVRALLNPTSIAVVGASEASHWATEIVNNILRWDFPGKVHMVNPGRAEVYGRPCYPSIAAIPERVDHALIVVRASLVASVLEDCAKAEVHAATVIASGFAEAGLVGKGYADEAHRLAIEHDIALIGPNCYGFLNIPSRAIVSRNWVEDDLRPDGRISMVFQSGQLNLSACGSAYQRGIDLRYMISSGNELVTNANDYFEYFIQDPGTTVLGGALERIPDPRRFEKLALKALEAGKPIVLVKLGSSEEGSAIATSHTGAVAGVRQVVDTFLHELGVIVVPNLDELIETAGLLVRRGVPDGPRVVFLGGSGGSGEFYADMVDGTAIRLPELTPETQARVAELTKLETASLHNPMDLTASGFRVLHEVAPFLARTGEFDVIVAQGEEPLSVEIQGERQVESLARSMDVFDGINAAGGYAVFNSSTDRAPTEFGKSQARAHNATYLRGQTGVAALHHAIEYGYRREKAVPRLRRIISARPEVSDDSSTRRVLAEFDAKSVLAEHGIPVTQDLRASSADAAVAAAESIGYPVVLKIDSPAIAHKSEIGGVVLDLKDPDAVVSAYEDVTARAAAAYPDVDTQSVIVAEQINGTIELIVGAVVDPSIGSVVLVGAGGIHVEVLHDTALALPPFDREKASVMLRSLAIWPILAGTRGQSGVNVQALEEMLVAVGDLVASYGSRLQELDINPVFADRTGVRAGDALIVVGGSS
jgi:acetate---CoA ligase (ADP-forming)